jgi:hypothetical protein
MGSQIINVMKLPIVVVKLHIIIVKVLTTVVKLHPAVVKLLCRAPKLLRRYQNCVIGHQSCYGVMQGAGWRDWSALFLYFFKMDFSLGRKGQHKKTRTLEKRNILPIRACNLSATSCAPELHHWAPKLLCRTP